MDKVSVIIPVYNMEKKIEMCLNSVINQTYKNIEIVIIDDGSQDNSYIKIKEKAKEDKRIKYYFQKNKGLSSARNLGIKKSTGNYIMFLDSDDYIENNTTELLLNKIYEDKSDICIGLLKYIKNGKEFNRKRALNDNRTYSNLECLKEMLLAKNIRFHAVAKLYKRELFYGIEFPVGRLYEDTGCIYKVIYAANKISYLDQKIYNYIFNENSISKSEFNLNKIDLMYFTNEIKSFMRKHNIYKECKEEYLNFKLDSYLSLYKEIKKSNSEKIDFLNEVAKINIIETIFSNKVLLKNKIKFLFKKLIY